MFRVDASQNSNSLTETKSGNDKIKPNNVNNTDRNDATGRPVSLNNEAIPDADVFPAPLPPPLTVPPFGGGEGPLFQLDNDNEDFEEEEDFNRDRDKNIRERKRTMRTSSMVNKSQNFPRTH